jgi:hypothetical protein
MKDRRELQRNLKGFITLSKYLLRGSQHDKEGKPADKAVVPPKAQDATV